MNLPSELAKQMADLIGVDEVTTVGSPRGGLMFTIKVDKLYQVVEVDHPVGMKPPAAIDYIVKMLFDAAVQLKGRVERDRRRAALDYLEYVDSIKRSTIGALGMPPSLLEQPEPEDRPRMTRFIALAQELEDM